VAAIRRPGNRPLLDAALIDELRQRVATMSA